MIIKAIYDLLIATPAITALLPTYNFGEVKAAIFTIDPVPKDASLPAIVISQSGGIRWGTRAKKGGEADVTITIWDDKKRTWKALREIAWLVWITCERASLTIDGYEEVGCLANLPRQLVDTDGFPGYIIDLMVRFIQE